MKLAAGFAVLFTASTQGFATAEEVASASNLAFLKLPGFPGKPAPANPFNFRNLELPLDFVSQGSTSIPMEWWQQGSSSPLAIVIGNAEGTRSLDGSMTPAYYWHQDPGNGANNFGSFSFQHLSDEETASVIRGASGDDKRLAAAQQALPEIADQRQLLKLRRFHDLLQIQAKRNGIQLTNLELINGLDLTTQSELAGLDAWGYVDRLAQMKRTIADPDEQIIRARTWSYWDPVKNRWAAPGLGNTEYYIRRDQARRFHAVKQALLYQERQPSLLQDIDLAWIERNGSNPSKPRSGSKAKPDTWAIALLQQQSNLEGSSFNRQPLQLDIARSGLDNLLAETVAAEFVLADTIAQNAVAITTLPDYIAPEDLDFKGELQRVKQDGALQLSESEAIEVALRVDRPLALETEAEPTWERLAMTPEEFTLATAIANPDAADTGLAETTAVLETDVIAEALETSIETSIIATSVKAVSAVAPSAPLNSSATQSAERVPLSSVDPQTFADAFAGNETRLEPSSTPASEIEPAVSSLELVGDINSSLMMVQPFMPEELQSLPLEAALEKEPERDAIKPGQSFTQTPEIVQVAAMAHVQAAEPLISDRIKSKEFLDLASGLKEDPIDVLEESLGLAIAVEAPPVQELGDEPDAMVVEDIHASRTTIHFSPQPEPLEQAEAWLANPAEAELAPPVEPIIPEDIQVILAQKPKPEAMTQPIAETVLFFEENLSSTEFDNLEISSTPAALAPLGEENKREGDNRQQTP